MTYYQDNLLPRIQNRIMDNKMMRERRRQVCRDLHGDVIEIQDVNQLLDAREKAGGGGGTDMSVAMKEIEERQLHVDMLIVFTDGYTPWGDDPGYPVVWCITTPNIEAPYGTSIHVSIPH